jgi:hypothetical protein
MDARDIPTPAQDPSLGPTTTTEDAAVILDISTAHLNTLLERERIPGAKIADGGRPLSADAVFDYKHRRDAARATMREAMQAGELLADEH